MNPTMVYACPEPDYDFVKTRTFTTPELFLGRVVKIKMTKRDVCFEVEVSAPITPEDMEWICGLMDMINATK